MELFDIELSAIAVNLHTAREKCGKTVKSCAAALGITNARYKKYESGELFPTLPELETLSYFMQIPLAELIHVQDGGSLCGAPIPDGDNLTHLMEIRDSVIGTLLQIERERNKFSLKTLATRCVIPVSRLKRWESGQNGIPMDELLRLTHELGIDVNTFFDVNSPIGIWQKKQQQIAAFLDLPQDLQAFVSNPENIAYISLANKMKELQPEDLENVSQALQLLVTKMSDDTPNSDPTKAE